MFLYHQLSQIKNNIDYPLRQFFRWRHGGLSIKNEPKDGLFDFLEPAVRETAIQNESRLRQDYDLEEFYANSRADNYRENLFYLSLVETALEKSGIALPDELLAVDVGPSDWFYVQAEYQALRWWRHPNGRQVQLWGYERDAYRVYTDFHSRYDHAIAHIRGNPNIRYFPEAFRPKPGKFDLAFLFFPFLFLKDHLEWGLPAGLFDPETLLANVARSLKPGGLLIVTNQGQAEHEAQRALLSHQPLDTLPSYLFESPFYHYDIPRFVTLTQRRV